MEKNYNLENELDRLWFNFNSRLQHKIKLTIVEVKKPENGEFYADQSNSSPKVGKWLRWFKVMRGEA